MITNSKTIYDETSAFYEEFINSFSADYNYYNSLFRIVQPSSVLEIGCGCGRLFKLYLNYCSDVVGVDLSEELASIAQRIYPSIKVHIADIVSFNLNRKFDLIVIGNSLLKHIESDKDRVKVLNNVKLHLANNGVISIDHSDYLYYESCSTDWINANCSIAAKWFPDKKGILSQLQWRKRVYDNHDNILWRRITADGFDSEVEYCAYKYDIVELQKHLLNLGLSYKRILTEYDKEGLGNDGNRFIAVVGMSSDHLSNIQNQVRKVFSLL